MDCSMPGFVSFNAGLLGFLHTSLSGCCISMLFLVYLALYEVNTDIHLSVHLLLCVNEVQVLMFSSVLSICQFVPFIGVCSMIAVCSPLFGTLLPVCPCAFLVCLSLRLFIYASSLLIFLALFGTLYMENVSNCFYILSRASSVC